MREKFLNIFLTFKCPLKCKHCLVRRKESWPLTVPKTHLLDLIREAGELGYTDLGFTGGEPFVEYELLREAIRVARSYGFQDIGVVTSAFWATSEGLALNILRNLGLDSITISYDEFHQSQVPHRYVKNAITAAKKLGMRVNIYHAETSEAWFVRAVRLGADEVFPFPVLFKHELGCPTELAVYPCDWMVQPNIHPAGIFACCNAAAMGYLYLCPLEDGIAKAEEIIENDDILVKLRDEGPIPVPESSPYPDGWRHQCEVCYHVYGKYRNIL